MYLVQRNPFYSKDKLCMSWSWTVKWQQIFGNQENEILKKRLSRLYFMVNICGEFLKCVFRPDKVK